MPLVNLSSNKARAENTRREIAAGIPVKRAVAIGYSKQRQAKKKGK